MLAVLLSLVPVCAGAVTRNRKLMERRKGEQ
jgi:hypothetical protein